MATQTHRSFVARWLLQLLPILVAACGGSADKTSSEAALASNPAPVSALTAQAGTQNAPLPATDASSPAPSTEFDPVAKHMTLGTASVATKVFDGILTLSTQPRFAGAIASLRFRGQEYIDTTDHGRLMQSASSFDGYGECYNPTEAGSRDDGAKPSTTSRLLRTESGERWLETETEMAFWLAPGTDYGASCGERSDTRRAANSEPLSRHVLAKHVAVGVSGEENVVGYFLQFNVPEARNSAVFEAATVYTPKIFGKRLVFDPSTGQLTATSHFGEQSLPVILATDDDRHAIGLFSPDLPRDGVGYGTFNFPDTNKINCVFRERDIRPGNYRYRCFFAVGSVSEVRKAIGALHAARATIGWP